MYRLKVTRGDLSAMRDIMFKVRGMTVDCGNIAEPVGW